MKYYMREPSAVSVFFQAAQMLKKPFALRVERGRGQVVQITYDSKTGGSIVTPESAWMNSKDILTFIQEHGYLTK